MPKHGRVENGGGGSMVAGPGGYQTVGQRINEPKLCPQHHLEMTPGKGGCVNCRKKAKTKKSK